MGSSCRKHIYAGFFFEAPIDGRTAFKASMPSPLPNRVLIISTSCDTKHMTYMSNLPALCLKPSLMLILLATKRLSNTKMLSEQRRDWKSPKGNSGTSWDSTCMYLFAACMQRNPCSILTTEATLAQLTTKSKSCSVNSKQMHRWAWTHLA